MAQRPEIDVVIELIKANPLPADIPGMRAAFDAGGGPPAQDVKIEKVTAGTVPCELHTPPGADTSRCLQYLHGGGYVIGSLTSHRALVAELARAAGCCALAVDYRMAPEHPYPAAVEDSVACYRWLLAEGYAPGSIVIAGDSAGGGLTIATMVALKAAGEPLPRAGVCVCPWVDLEGTGETYSSRADVDPFVTREMIMMLAQTYLAGGDPRAATASPIHADLAGLPPLLIQVGSREVLFADADALRQRASDAGVSVTFEEWPDMIHVWHLYAPMLAEGRQAIARIGEYAKQQWAA